MDTGKGYRHNIITSLNMKMSKKWTQGVHMLTNISLPAVALAWEKMRDWLGLQHISNLIHEKYLLLLWVSYL